MVYTLTNTLIELGHRELETDSRRQEWKEGGEKSVQKWRQS